MVNNMNNPNKKKQTKKDKKKQRMQPAQPADSRGAQNIYHFHGAPSTRGAPYHNKWIQPATRA
jgi:hypothetical protein